MDIIRKRQRYTNRFYTHSYSWDTPDSGWGFSFDCEPNGRIDESKLHECAILNLRMCERGQDETGRRIFYNGIKSWELSGIDPAQGRCKCGQVVTLDDPLDNFCQCGLCYNMSGQQVIPSNELDDETGEYLHGDW